EIDADKLEGTFTLEGEVEAEKEENEEDESKEEESEEKDESKKEEKSVEEESKSSEPEETEKDQEVSKEVNNKLTTDESVSEEKSNSDENEKEKNDESDKEEISTLVGNDESKKITENIIDKIHLKREDGTEYKEGDQLEFDEDLELGLDWSLPNDHNYTNGDTFEFYLPEQLNIYSEVTGDLGEFGSFVVTTDGHVTFTFNEKIETNSDVKGTFWIKTELDKQKVTSSTEELEIIFNDEVAKKITINVKPEGGQAIHKEGQPVDGSFNTDEIEWTVLIN